MTVLFTLSIQAQYEVYIRQQYQNLLQHMHIIKKCYWQKLPCSLEEKERADRFVQIGLLGGGILALVGGYKGIGLLANQYQINKAKSIVKRVIPNAQEIRIVRHKYPYDNVRERIIVTVPYKKEIKGEKDTIIKSLTKYFPGKELSLQTPNGVIFTEMLK